MKATISSRRCFVVMPFGKRSDRGGRRTLDLDLTYSDLIKPVVEKRLACVRGDEIIHSGVIDLAILRELWTADVVIADLTTENPNVLYELGIRHALRPHSTIVISASKPPFPFDINRVKFIPYTHHGDDIGHRELERFQRVLREMLDAVLAKPEMDSPVYTFLQDLKPPALPGSAASQATAWARNDGGSTRKRSPLAAVNEKETLAVLIKKGEAALSGDRFDQARDYFAKAVKLYGGGRAARSRIAPDPYLVQRLALATYRAKRPTELMALVEAKSHLEVLKPYDSNDPETAGLAGDLEKGLFDNGQGESHLDNAILLYGRRLQLRREPHDALTLASALMAHAAVLQEVAPQTARANLVRANNIWQEVLEISSKALAAIRQRQRRQGRSSKRVPPAQLAQSREHEFRYVAAMAEASFGLGLIKTYQRHLSRAKSLKAPAWMVTALEEKVTGLRQLVEKLRPLLGRQGSELDPGKKQREEKTT